VTVTSLKTVIKFWFLDPSSGFSLWFTVTQLETKNASSEEWKREKGRQWKRKVQVKMAVNATVKWKISEVCFE
jgi:hypothetical protein